MASDLVKATQLVLGGDSAGTQASRLSARGSFHPTTQLGNEGYSTPEATPQW